MSSSSPAAHFLSAFFSAPPLPDEEGQSIAGYTLGPLIGYGATSIIRKVYSSTDSVAAVKIIRRTDLQSRAHTRLQREAAIWASLSHEHILPLFTTISTDYADYFFTLYCPAGSLFDILKRDGSPALLHDDAGMMFRQVVRGLRYLHDTAHYVHRDIKLENVLVDDMGICKIGDFGMAKKFHPSSILIGNFSDELDSDEESDDDESDDPPRLIQRASSLVTPSPKRSSRHSIPSYPGGLGRYNTIQHRHSKPKRSPFFQPGSLPYAAPELLLPQTSESLRPRPHPGQDIWALGVLLYALLTGKLPFMDSFEQRLQIKILTGQYDLPNDIGLGAERILKGCLERNIHNRWTIAMVDEVAWGVGWSAAGGPLQMHDEEDEHEAEQEQQERLPATTSCSFNKKKKKNGSPVEPGNIFLPSRSQSRSGSRSHSGARYHPTSPPSRRRSPSRTKPSSCPPVAQPIFINTSRSPSSSSSSRHRYYRTHRSMSRSDSPSTTFSPVFPNSPVDSHVIEGDEWVLDPMRIQPWLDVDVRRRPDRGRRRMRDDAWDVVGSRSTSISISPVVVAKPVTKMNGKERLSPPSLSEHSRRG